MNQHPEQLRSNDTLKTAVMDCIHNRTVTPRSRLYFQAFETGMWILWVLSIAVGATAVAIILYVGEHGAYALVEATHESAFAFWVDVLPYAWVGLFLVMGGAAYLNFRRTCRGYRYSNAMVIGSSVGLSVLFGAVLHVGGFSGTIEKQFARMPHYPSMEKKELAMWQNPADGRLVGMAIEMYEDKRIDFIDVQNFRWTIATMDLNQRDLETLFSGQRVKLIGLASSTRSAYFHGCAAFLWPYQVIQTVEEMKKIRAEFRDRMNDYQTMTKESDNAALEGSSPCVQLKILERLP